MKYYQDGGQQGNPQEMMQQIAQAFQQLPPEAQQQLLQALSQMVQQSAGDGDGDEQQAQQQQQQQPGAEAVMRAGGFRSNPSNNMYR